MAWDQIDRKLVEYLYENANQSRAEMASKLSISRNEVDERIERMADANVIDFSVVIDPATVGQDTPSYHFISFNENYDEVIRDEMQYFDHWSGSQLALVVLGDIDLVFRKLNEDTASMDVFATNVLSGTTGESADDGTSDQFKPFSMAEDLESFDVSQRIRWHGTNIPSDRQRGTTTYDLDEVEKQVLVELQRNGRLRYETEPLSEAVSERVEATPTDVVEAVEFFEDNGIILNDSITFDASALGLYRGFFGLSALRGEYGKVVDQLKQESPFHVPYALSGPGFRWADIAIELVFDSLEELDEITDVLRSLDGVKASRTFVATKALYYDDFVPLSGS